MRVKKNTTAIAFVFMAVLTLTASAAAQVAGEHWVSAWGAAPHASLHYPGMPPTPVVENQTVRMVARTTIDGKRLRIRFSNAYGTAALKIGAAHVALIEKGSKIVPESDRVLTFGGKRFITIPSGAPALSDPVDLNVPAFAEVAVSIFLPEKTPLSTMHQLGQHDTYAGGPGDLTSSVEIPHVFMNHSWYWLSGIEFWSSKNSAAIVAFGDSITDGFGAKGEYQDWPNQLAKRLASVDGSKWAVVNEGIGGNRVLHDGMGVSALARFDRDVLANPGVSTLLVLEGVNDVGWPHMKPPKGMDLSKIKMPDLSVEDVTADDLIAGMRQMIDRAHEHGIRVYGATVTPFKESDMYSDAGEATRQALNHWIRTSGAFDGVFDFDAAVRDPEYPTRFREGFHAGDHLHPNDAGYKAMTDAIDISVFKKGK